MEKPSAVRMILAWSLDTLMCGKVMVQFGSRPMVISLNVCSGIMFQPFCWSEEENMNRTPSAMVWTPSSIRTKSPSLMILESR